MIFAVSIPAVYAQDPPQYELIWIDNVLHPGAGIRLKDLNEDGGVVGHAGGFESWGNYTLSWDRAVMFDRVNGMQNLNELEGVSWTDLETGETWPQNETETPWIAARANGINEVNAFGEFQIVGTAIRRDHQPRAYVLTITINTSTDPEFKLLPRFGGVTNYGKAINDLGIAIGDGDDIIVFDPANNYQPVGIAVAASGQEINNSGVIVTRGEDFSEGYVISPNPAGSFDYSNAFIDLQEALYGINDVGVVCGLRKRTGGRNKLAGGVVRFHYEYGQNGHVRTNDDLLTEAGGASYFCDVNNLGDVCFLESGRGWVYLDGNGFYNLEDHIAFDPNSQDEEDWLSTNIQPQGINDQRQIIIRTASSQRGALLTPIVPGPTISVDDVAIDEGNVGTTTDGQFTVTLSGLTGQNVTVPYQIVDGSATTADNDYSTIAAAGSLTFNFVAGETEKTVDFTINGDDKLEADETFSIQLEEATGGATIADGEGIATINNDEQAPTSTFESEDTPLDIPDRDTVSSFLLVPDDVTIFDLTVTLDIAHDRASDLTVSLIAPDGTWLDLDVLDGENQTNGAFNDLVTIHGIWELRISDVKKKKAGTLISWSMIAELN